MTDPITQPDEEPSERTDEGRPETGGHSGPTWAHKRGGVAISTDRGTVSLDEEDAEEIALGVLRSLNGGSILLDAYEVAQERADEYGPPDENFEAAADLQSAYLGTDADGFDYAIGMILAKVGRLQTGDRTRDSLLDIAGYARAAAVVEGVNEGQ